ncbi:hypothetical protein L107_11510 [Cyanobium sp. Copco_Reservoir_LC18]|uniref:hypothetical protein n=1 Tax=Cyanobium sp. Copco_Reservoir_LC18 TaxID=1328305 RepID=UPI0013587F6F|nr:hypothetical protein [Cyanobium sp. Copco_Reservoir_LC18]KAF0652778.1 hypothetical protein L107_11510 [Cyanobium sp. Copco_Reservoir_LC18]
MGPSPSDETSSLIRNLSIFTASVVSLSGAFQAWSSMQITHSLEEARRTQAFSRQILDQMDNLTGENETKGKVALIGLYIIAANDKDKMNIANIALQSGKNSLRDAAAFLLRQECKELPQQSTCKNALEMLARTEDVIVQRQIRKEDKLIGDSPGARLQEAVVNVQVQPSPVAQALEEITTAKIAASDLQGWIYIGKADPSGALLDDRTINVARKPSPNADVTTITSVYLRSQGTIRSGSSLGIIPRGQVLRIHALRSRPMTAGNEAVWAKVKTQRGSLQSVP